MFFKCCIFSQQKNIFKNTYFKNELSSDNYSEEFVLENNKLVILLPSSIFIGKLLPKKGGRK